MIIYCLYRRIRQLAVQAGSAGLALAAHIFLKFAIVADCFATLAALASVPQLALEAAGVI